MTLTVGPLTAPGRRAVAARVLIAALALGAHLEARAQSTMSFASESVVLLNFAAAQASGEVRVEYKNLVAREIVFGGVDPVFVQAEQLFVDDFQAEWLTYVFTARDSEVPIELGRLTVSSFGQCLRFEYEFEPDADSEFGFFAEDIFGWVSASATDANDAFASGDVFFQQGSDGFQDTEAGCFDEGPSFEDRDFPGDLEEAFVDAPLTRNERTTAVAVQNVCAALAAEAEERQLTDPQQELLTACALIIDNVERPDQQRQAVRALSGQPMLSQQVAGMELSRNQIQSLSARLSALRQGATGISLAGFTIRDGHRRVPVHTLMAMANDLLQLQGDNGTEAPLGFIEGPLGLFVNGNLQIGKRRESANTSRFDFDSQRILVGADYRFTDSLVLGAAGGYTWNKVEFAADSGRVRSDSWNGSLFGSVYGDDYYLDFIGTYSSLDNDTTRRITYTPFDGAEEFTRTATGSTDGRQLLAALGGGYTLRRGGAYFGPTFSADYVRMNLDGFRETGAGGLDLQFEDVSNESLTTRLGMRAGRSWNTQTGVLVPQLRVNWVREYANRGEEVRVYFANDPMAGDPSSPSSFVLASDRPDISYFALGAGISAQFPRGLSAFVDYETYAGYRHVRSHEFAVGLRFQTPLR